MKSIKKLFLRSVLWILSPLTLLYQSLFLFDRYRTKPERLEFCYVISVGNLTVGGTGKTPFVHFLILTLRKFFPDYQFTILSRGYKAKLSKVGALVKADSLASEVGDEPLLHKLNFEDVQVIIGQNRISSFYKYNQVKSKKHIVILDDGFQHHKLKRDLDIVLIDANSPIGNGFTIPLGYLREKPSGLKRADMIVYTKLNEINLTNISSLEAKEFSNINIPSFRSKFLPSLQIAYRPTTSNEKYYLVTGVGNPSAVYDTAKEVLADSVISTKFFSDHYDYKEEEMLALLAEIGERTSFLTTEKDWVKWKSLDHFLNEIRKRGIGVSLLTIQFEVENLNSFEELLYSRVSNYAKEIEPA